MEFASAPVQWKVNSLQRREYFDLAEVSDRGTSLGLALLFEEQSRCLQHYQRLQEAACGGVLRVEGKYMMGSRFALLCEKGKLAERQMEEYPEEIHLEELVELGKELLGTLRDLHAKRVCGFAIELSSVVIVEDGEQLVRLFDFRADTKGQSARQAQDVYEAGAFLLCMTALKNIVLPSESKARQALVLEHTAHLDFWGRFLLDVLETSKSAAKLCEALESPNSASCPETNAGQESFGIVLEWLAHGFPGAATRELSAMLEKVQRGGGRLEVGVSGSPPLTCCSCKKVQTSKHLLRLVCLHLICEGCLREAARRQPISCFICPVLLELQSQEISRLSANLQESYAAYEWQLAP